MTFDGMNGKKKNNRISVYRMSLVSQFPFLFSLSILQFHANIANINIIVRTSWKNKEESISSSRSSRSEYWNQKIRAPEERENEEEWRMGKGGNERERESKDRRDYFSLFLNEVKFMKLRNPASTRFVISQFFDIIPMDIYWWWRTTNLRLNKRKVHDTPTNAMTNRIVSNWIARVLPTWKSALYPYTDASEQRKKNSIMVMIISIHVEEVNFVIHFL